MANESYFRFDDDHCSESNYFDISTLSVKRHCSHSVNFDNPFISDMSSYMMFHPTKFVSFAFFHMHKNARKITKPWRRITKPYKRITSNPKKKLLISKQNSNPSSWIMTISVYNIKVICQGENKHCVKDMYR